jgi:hypothetical protein
VGRRPARENGEDVGNGEGAHGVDGLAGLGTEVRGDDDVIGEVVGKQR